MLEKINEAYANNKYLFVEGYINSSGDKKDILLKPLENDGYGKMIKASLEVINSRTSFFIKELKPYNVDMLLWAECVSEVIDSFNKYINSSKEEGKPRKNSFVKSGNVYHPINAEDSSIDTSRIALKHLEVMNHLEQKEPKDTSKTELKSLIKSNLPIGRYLPQLNLYPGKFSELRLIDKEPIK